MERHQRIQLKKTSRSTNQPFQVSPFQTSGFGVQQKAASTPASKTELWENYQRSTQMTQKGSNPTVAGIQAKLTIGQPGDKYEQEADSVADRVMAMSEPAQVQREELGEEEEELQMKPLAGTISPLVQREELPEEEEELQMKPDDNLVQREELPEEEEELQMKSLDNSIQREELPEEEEEIQMKEAATSSTPAATTSLEDRLSSSKGGGSPLSDDVRSFMEPRFGADFSGVRVHTGSDAVQMNQDVNAQAFAHGQDVYFGAGKAPGKDTLTAHELTHVVQQTGVMEFQRKEENIIQAKFPWEKMASEAACAVLDDEEIYGLFINFYFSSQPNAQKHLEHYVKGGGKDYTENVQDLLGANPRIRSRIVKLIDEQMTADPTTTSNTIVGKGADDGENPPIRQSDYDSEDWRNANGNIDEVSWQVIGAYDPARANKFQISITDPYTWHPLEKRPTQCLHEAFERLKSKSAADYITRGTAEIVLPPVWQSPDVPIESELDN
jgi:Domain of unknown function (DUF4157)